MSTVAIPSLDASSFEFVRDLLLRRSAILLEPGKDYLVESRLAPLARKHGLGGVADLVAQLRRLPYGALHDQVIDAMTTNETSFFRDLHPFEAMRNVVLPELIRRRAARRTLNIWSAAASSGQEPFTVAMLLRDHFAQQVAGWSIGILASDLSSEMLDKAREGRFTQLEVNRGLPAAMLLKHFTKQGNDWRISDEIRRMVQFRRLNLIEPWPPLPPMDVILLRNVLIYFSVETKRQILAHVRRVLSPDGFLFLGGAETTLNLDDAFERVKYDRSGCYRLCTR